MDAFEPKKTAIVNGRHRSLVLDLYMNQWDFSVHDAVLPLLLERRNDEGKKHTPSPSFDALPPLLEQWLERYGALPEHVVLGVRSDLFLPHGRNFSDGLRALELFLKTVASTRSRRNSVESTIIIQTRSSLLALALPLLSRNKRRVEVHLGIEPSAGRGSTWVGSPLQERLLLAKLLSGVGVAVVGQISFAPEQGLSRGEARVLQVFAPYLQGVRFIPFRTTIGSARHHPTHRRVIEEKRRLRYFSVPRPHAKIEAPYP